MPCQSESSSLISYDLSNILVIIGGKQMQVETNLVFGPELAASKYGLLQCTEEFVELLRGKSEIRIEGTHLLKFRQQR